MGRTGRHCWSRSLPRLSRKQLREWSSARRRRRVDGSLDKRLTHRDMQYFPNAAHAKTMTTEELRSSFLLSGLFTPGQINLRITDLDRAVIGGAVPLGNPITLDTHEALKAEYFTERREVGILNIGGDGSVSAGGNNYDLKARDVLYAGRGTRDISFSSKDPSNPARFYIISYPAHATHPIELVTADKA